MKIRRALPQDAAVAAEWIAATMAGFGEYVFGAGDHNRAVQGLAGLFRQPVNRFSYQRAWVLEVDDQPAAGLVAFPGSELNTADRAMLWQVPRVYGLAGALGLAHRGRKAQDPWEATPDHFYIAHVAVSPAFQRRGLGRALLDHAAQQAVQTGLSRLALTVDFGNDNARRLYLNCGFEVVERVSTPALEKFGLTGYEHLVKILHP